MISSSERPHDPPGAGVDDATRAGSTQAKLRYLNGVAHPTGHLPAIIWVGDHDVP
jgi:hypothetical protein